VTGRGLRRRRKISGFGGRDNALEALQQYTELKTMWITLR
jgi:gamma-glutamyl-gamma-aminobutyraldehyde dehydrogenase